MSLSACKLSDLEMSDLSSLLRSKQNITSLDLSCNYLTLEGLKRIFEHTKFSFQPSLLELLDLSYNSLGDEGLLYIADLISAGCLPNLKYLSLREVSNYSNY